MQTRELKIMFSKNGAGRTSPKINLPLPWLQAMGLDDNNRSVNLSFDGEKIIISNAPKNPDSTN